MNFLAVCPVAIIAARNAAVIVKVLFMLVCVLLLEKYEVSCVQSYVNHVIPTTYYTNDSEPKDKQTLKWGMENQF